MAEGSQTVSYCAVAHSTEWEAGLSGQADCRVFPLLSPLKSLNFFFFEGHGSFILFLYLFLFMFVVLSMTI